MNKITKILLPLSVALLLPQSARADVTIWVKSSTAPHVFAWNGDTKPLGDFPGTQLSVQDDVTGWWLCYLPDLDEADIIFSYGTGGYGNQTADIKGVTGTHYYQYPGGGDNGTYTDLGTDVATITNPPTGVAINSENFPDPVFRQWLSTYTYVEKPNWFPYVYCDLDGKGTDYLLTATEIANTTILCLNSSATGIYLCQPELSELSDLTGIERFTSLKGLLLCGTNVTTLSQLSGHPTLEAFSTQGMSHKLNSLDLSNCTSLEYLDCSNHYSSSVSARLACINLTGCGALVDLNCKYNELETIDLSDCTNLLRLQLVASN